jgi:hypothetical protein
VTTTLAPAPRQKEFLGWVSISPPFIRHFDDMIEAPLGKDGDHAVQAPAPLSRTDR